MSDTGRTAWSRTFRERFAPTSNVGSQCRELVREHCEAWGVGAVTKDAEIVVTELVSNAVEHAATELDVVVSLRGDYLHLAVHDGDPTPPRRSDAAPDGSARGRGLLLVDAMATSWGCEQADGGKVVWATLRLR